MEKGSAWRSEYQNAVGVCPDRVRPEASVIVPDIIRGNSMPDSAKILFRRPYRGFGVESIEHGFDEEDVGPSLDEAAYRFLIGCREFVEGYRPEAAFPRPATC